jgi:hypothetical protein
VLVSRTVAEKKIEIFLSNRLKNLCNLPCVPVNANLRSVQHKR